MYAHSAGPRVVTYDAESKAEYEKVGPAAHALRRRRARASLTRRRRSRT